MLYAAGVENNSFSIMAIVNTTMLLKYRVSRVY